MTRRNETLDLVLVAAIVIVTQLEVWAPNALLTPTHMTGPHLAVSVAYLLAALALVFRRRFPLASAVMVCVPLAVEWLAFGAPESFGSFALPIIAAYSVAAHADRRRALVGLGALVATATIWSLRDPMQTSVAKHLGALLWLSPIAIAWLLGSYLRRRRLAERHERALRSRREREERARIAVAEERARIARELHDAVGHSVSVMTVQTSAVRRLLQPEQEREHQALGAVERTGREALAEMRRMVGVLRDPEEAPMLAPQPGLSELDRVVEQTRAAGLEVEFRAEGAAAPLPPGVALTAYRLVQEGLTNALKHAHARRAEVLLRYAVGAIEIVVSDDGRGGTAESDEGHGLIGLRERVSIYGGELAAGPRPEGGFELRARLPVAAA